MLSALPASVNAEHDGPVVACSPDIRLGVQLLTTLSERAAIRAAHHSLQSYGGFLSMSAACRDFDLFARYVCNSAC